MKMINRILLALILATISASPSFAANGLFEPGGDLSGTWNNQTVKGINGQNMAALSTGVLKNTTTTGVPSIALLSDILAYFTGTCNSSTFVNGAGACSTPAGGGNMSNSGSPTAHQTGVFVTSTTIEGVGPGTTGQVLTSGGASADPSYSSTPTLTGTNFSGVPTTALTGALQAGQEPAHTGDATNSAGNLAMTVKGANGVLYSSLSTGVLKNTTTTGVPSIALLSDILAYFTGTCNSSTFVNGAGACATPTGSGTVNSGGPTQIAGYVSSGTTVSGLAPATVLAYINAATCNAQSGTTYTPVLGDANGCITLTNASSIAATQPTNASVAYAVGTTLTYIQGGAGAVTLSPAGGGTVTICSVQFGCSTSQAYTLTGINDFVQLKQTATNSWFVTGVGPGRATQDGLTNLASTAFGGVKNILPLANGGTGQATLAAANIVIETGTPVASNCTAWNSATVVKDNGSPCPVGGSTSQASGTSMTPTCATAVNFSTNTATAGTFTVNAPTGCTPVEGQSMKIHMKSSNVQTFAWNAAFVGGTIALPTATTGTSKEDWFGFLWSSIDSKWQFVASATGF